jgi:hypothetical protein
MISKWIQKNQFQGEKMLILEFKGSFHKFESHDALFKFISKEGYFIENLTESEISCVNKSKAKETFFYGEVSHEHTKDSLVEAIIVEKDLVKKSMEVMYEQGIEFTPAQKNDLNAKFKILKQFEEQK